MELKSDSIDDGREIDGKYAFCVPDPENKVRFSENISPHFEWDGLPGGTESLVLICHDSDVPSKPDDVNVEGREVPEDLERIDFYHWVMVDLDPDAGSLEEGAFSEDVTPRGKDGPEGPLGTRQGLNDYTNWFAEDPEMEGNYYGYDGPCPPWNDSIVHHYHFTLYALDVEQAPVEGTFTGDDVLEAIDGHILDQDSITGLYTLNPNVEI